MVQPDPGNPSVCLVYGWVTDAQGTAQASVTVAYEIAEDDVMTNTGKNVRKISQTVTTDSNGYFEISLFRSVNLVPSGSKYLLTIAAIGFRKKITVPNLATARLDTLV